MSALLRNREADAKELLAFHRCETDKHPRGLSGRRFITPHGSKCWDTAPKAYERSEWGNQAGMVK